MKTKPKPPSLAMKVVVYLAMALVLLACSEQKDPSAPVLTTEAEIQQRIHKAVQDAADRDGEIQLHMLKCGERNSKLPVSERKPCG